MIAPQPSEPIRILPDPAWEHYALYQRITDAIQSLPLYFRTETIISGVSATDVFTLNATLGATIEEQVVSTLNVMRPFWDPHDAYKTHGFIRQSQTFPDVLFKDFHSGTQPAIMGIELKGWYLLAKEGEPSFRFQVTPSVCAIQDLIVVVPWTLSNVISGSPQVFAPFVESSRYAAEYRNYHWQYLRGAKSASAIILAQDLAHYPKKSDRIVDKPVSDAGNNFGRFARTGIMDQYLVLARSQLLRGIEAKYWLAFFRAFQEQGSNTAIEAEIERLRRRLAVDGLAADDVTIERVRAVVGEIEKLLS